MQVPAEHALAVGAARRAWRPGRPGASMIRPSARAFRVVIAWALFVLLNLIAMRLSPSWGSVPFLIIWISLTLMYGFRLWHVGSTVLTVSLVTLAAGGLIGWQGARGGAGGGHRR